jgi:hypothetical protein
MSKRTKLARPVALALASLCCGGCQGPSRAESTEGGREVDATGHGVPERQRAGFDAIRETRLRANLTFIASDALGGRLSLRPGDDVAARWVASELEKAGLAPAATDASGKPSFLQQVDLVEYSPDRAATTVTLAGVAGHAETVWHGPQVVGEFKDDVDVTAPVLFAGFGITAPELGYDDYRGVDAHGKIVLVFDHEPQELDPSSVFNGTGNTRYATERVKLLTAQAHGAVALISVAEPNRKHLTTAERRARIGGSTQRSVPLPRQVLADDEVKIPVVVVTDEVAATLMETSGKTPADWQTAIDRDLTPQSRPLPDMTVTLHLRNESRTVGTTHNVAGLLPGSDRDLASETILISGHHDHDGESPASDGKGDGSVRAEMDVWHGADDNGSGTVGVVELAHAFAANRDRPRRSILFVVFASEERGLLGSYWMAAHPLRPVSTTRAMINFDLIGRDEAPSPQTDGILEIPADTTNRLNLVGALYSPDYDRAIREENLHVGLVLDDRFDHESALNVLFRSDQFPFLLKDVPAFWWFTGFHPDYHHTTDTADRIHYSKMVKILQLAYLTAWHLGDANAAPRFLANPGGRTAPGSGASAR